MKWIFIVTWVLSYTVPTPCPDANKVDEWGRKSMMTCAVYHCKVVKESHSKTFYNRDEAIIFYKKSMKEQGDNNSFIFNNGIIDVKIDSIPFSKDSTLYYRVVADSLIIE